MNNLKPEKWWPMEPQKGPPLPRSMKFYWPWYKPPVVPPEEAPPVPPEEIPTPPPGYHYLYIYTVGNGIVTPSSGNYLVGSTITLTAIPRAEAEFDHWAGDVAGTSTMVNITMNRSKAVTAYFKAIVPTPPYEEAPPPEEIPPVPPKKVVKVSLKNPPAEGDIWQLYITNASKTDWRFIQHIPIDGIASFDDIPPDWDFPLPVVLTVHQRIGPDAVREIYTIQSYWGAGEKNYAPVYIPSAGSYYFNFTTKRFEKV